MFLNHWEQQEETIQKFRYKCSDNVLRFGVGIHVLTLIIIILNTTILFCFSFIPLLWISHRKISLFNCLPKIIFTHGFNNSLCLCFGKNNRGIPWHSENISIKTPTDAKTHDFLSTLCGVIYYLHTISAHGSIHILSIISRLRTVWKRQRLWK